MEYTLENEWLTIQVEEHGAELKSMKDKENREYLWCGDPDYWGRTSPVLFPIVGSLKKKEYRYQDKTYTMGQHGFARDMDFTLSERTEDTLWFSLSSNEETMEKYPFEFLLEIGYQLVKNSVKVMWRVQNTGKDTMHFSIGAHPAFNCPLGQDESKVGYGMDFGTGADVVYHRINGEGLELSEEHVLDTERGFVRFTEDFYDEGVYIVEKRQSQKASLLDREGRPYITLEFDAPLWGTWSPEGKNAPFVCIEPWYGRCDGATFDGSLEEREYGNALEPAKQFEASYVIRVDRA